MGLLDRIRVSRELEEEVLRLRCEIRALRRDERTGTSTPRRGEYEPLLLAIRALRDATTLDAFAGLALATALDMTSAARGAIMVREGETLVVIAARTREGLIDPSTFPHSRTVAFAAAREGHVVASGRAAENDRFRVAESVKRYAIDSVLCLPLRRGGVPAGCLYLEADGSAGAFEHAHPPLVVAFTDVVSNAIERLETELEALRRSRLEGAGLAAASIAHDMVSPLATAELALRELDPSAPSAGEDLAVVRRAIARAREIASSIVWLASGRDRGLVAGAVRLGDVVREHLAEIGRELAAARVVVEERLEHDGDVVADRAALLRVLSNLARNAEHAMPDGGPLVYRSGRSGGEAWIELEDRGIGIPAERLAKLFRPFESFGKHRGAGLGLTLSRELVLGMGGRIEVASEPGKGTRFRVTLRAAAAP